MDRPLRYQRDQGSMWPLVSILSILAIVGGYAYLLHHQTELDHELQRRNQAGNDTHIIQLIAEKWVADHASCPTPEGLRVAGELSEHSKVTDPWDTPYMIQCASNGDVLAQSAGPDRKLGTSDDIDSTMPVRPASVD